MRMVADDCVRAGVYERASERALCFVCDGRVLLAPVDKDDLRVAVRCRLGDNSGGIRYARAKDRILRNDGDTRVLRVVVQNVACRNFLRVSACGNPRAREGGHCVGISVFAVVQRVIVGQGEVREARARERWYIFLCDRKFKRTARRSLVLLRDACLKVADDGPVFRKKSAYAAKGIGFPFPFHQRLHAAREHNIPDKKDTVRWRDRADGKRAKRSRFAKKERRRDEEAYQRKSRTNCCRSRTRVHNCGIIYARTRVCLRRALVEARVK
mgnify:CR=1 FL=1